MGLFSSKKENVLEKSLESTLKNEGFRSKPYLDSKGILTIGHGINLESFKIAKLGDDFGVDFDYLYFLEHLEVTEEQSEKFVRNRLEKIFNKLNGKFVFFNELPEDAMAVLVEMAYQMGIDGLSKFKNTLSFLRDGEFYNASVEMLDSQWYKSDSPNRAKRLSNIIRDC